MGISFENVSYRYPGEALTAQLALDGVSFEISAGRMIAVLGAPGSGKSTLLQHMNGLLLPEEGRIRIFDTEVGPGARRDAAAALRKRVGLVFQYPEQQLFEETVEKDLRFGPLNFGASAEAADLAARQAAEAMGLADAWLAKSPFELSSGQMRKAAVAAVLAADPDVLVADEPTASLDPASRTELLDLLEGLCRNRGKTVMIVTHRLEEVLGRADEYLVLSDGKVVFQGIEPALLRRTDILEAAGLVAPAAVRLSEAIGARFGVRPPSDQRGPADTAAWIAGELLIGGDSGNRRDRGAGRGDGS